jgi:dynein heavy chain
LQEYLGRVRRNFKAILNLTPNGKILSKELRKYPSIISCSTLIWMDPWPEEGYKDVGMVQLDIPDLLEKEEVVR